MLLKRLAVIITFVVVAGCGPEYKKLDEAAIKERLKKHIPDYQDCQRFIRIKNWDASTGSLRFMVEYQPAFYQEASMWDRIHAINVTRLNAEKTVVLEFDRHEVEDLKAEYRYENGKLHIEKIGKKISPFTAGRMQELANDAGAAALIAF